MTAQRKPAANQADVADSKGSSADAPGGLKAFGKYSIRKKIGSGGMGAVFLADDTELKRQVALKVLPKDKAANPTLVKRFKSEAQAAAQLKHENIVAIYETGEIDGYLFIALEYVDSVDVHALIARKGAVPVKRSIEIVKQVARALEHAAGKNIVHRDIKPSNLLIGRDGTVKLTDLGLARCLDETTETGITRVGTTVGTVDYMAPEQARDSKSADLRSDIYSLGCTWYQMLTGRLPFPESSLTNKLHAHASKPVPDPRDIDPTVPEAVVAVLRRMMAKSPGERYQTAGELLADIDSAGLVRETVSNQILAALADDEAEDAKTRAAEEAALPRARKKRENAPPVQVSVSPEFVRNAVIAAIVLAVVIVVWRSSGQLGSGLGVSQPDGFAARPAGEPGEVDGEAGRSEEGRPVERTTRKPADMSKSGSSSGDSGPVVIRRSGTPKNTLKTKASDATETGTHGFAARSIRPGEHEYLPAWVNEIEAPTSRTAGAGSAGSLATFTVGPGPLTPTHFSSLEDAFGKLPKGGGLIELIGSGPFLLPALEFTGPAKLVLRGAEGARPLLVFSPGRVGNAPTDAILDLSRTALWLEGIDCTVIAAQFPDSGELALIAAQQADIVIRRCSLTLLGQRPGKTAALRIGRPHRATDTSAAVAKHPTRVFLEDTFISGSSLAAIEVHAPGTELVSTNCVLSSGFAPVVRLAHQPRIVSGSQQPPADVRQDLVFLSTTIAAAGHAFEMSCQPIEVDQTRAASAVVELGPVNVTWVNSLLAAAASPTGASGPTLLLLEGWPQKKLRAAGESRFIGLRWMSASSVYSGWNELLRVDGSEPLRVTADRDWQRTWGDGEVGDGFDTARWPLFSPTPPGNDRPDSAGGTTPQAFGPEPFSPAGVQATDGDSPGCLVSRLSSPREFDLRRAERLVGFPQIPHELIGWQPVRTIQVDTLKDDLGKVLADQDWPDKTLVVVSGSGNRTCSPFAVRGKKLRIEFKQPSGVPLTTVAQPNESATGNDAFITVENGSIELVNGRIKIPVTTRRNGPAWFLNVNGGSFVLNNCIVDGPMAPTNGFVGLIRFTGDSPADTNSPLPTQFGVIADSFLATQGPVVRSDIRGKLLVGRNSVFVSLNDIFNLSIAPGAASARGSVQLERCTLSAVETYLNISDPVVGRFPAGSATFLVEQTVFAPPLDPGGQNNPAPTLLRSQRSMVSQRAVEWWGMSNGYTGEIARYLHDPFAAAGNEATEGSPSADAAARFERDWLETWGADHVVRPVHGGEDVRLARPLPHRERVTAADFELFNLCKAKNWAAGGKPIGADPSTWGRLAQLAAYESARIDLAVNEAGRERWAVAEAVVQPQTAAPSSNATGTKPIRKPDF